MELTTSWHEKGKLEGVQIGKKQGMQIDKKEGISVGQKEVRREVAKNLLGLGLPMEQIRLATGLTPKEIEDLVQDKADH